MNIPAYTCPDLCLGRVYDAETSSPGNDIFPAGIPVQKIDVNTFSFKYQVVKTNKDVKDLLDVSGELSLKIKANVLSVGGAGKYLNEKITEEPGTTQLLAVMKCFTVKETMDGSAKPKEDVVTGQLSEHLGTHYVRTVTYGAEMVASVKFKSSKSTAKKEIKGGAEGELNFLVGDVDLKAQLTKLSSECEDASNISISYYATDLPEKLPTTLESLVTLIEEFPSRLKEINSYQGVPTMFELQPLHNIIPTAKRCLRVRALSSEVEDVESSFDDLRNTQSLVRKYSDSLKDQLDEDVRKFNSEIRTVLRKFNTAIQYLGTSGEKKQVEVCLEAYEKALDGINDIGKFGRHWKKILTTKAPTTSLKLPEGKPLTVVLLGKTGNGKSATGNRIIGEDVFKVSGSAMSITQKCLCKNRTQERQIDVIDTPGVLDTSLVSKYGSWSLFLSGYTEDQKRILREVSKIFVMAPYGFNAVILVAKYGVRFTTEDAQALKMLQGFLGKEANSYTFLLLTWGDQAEHEANEAKMSVDDHLKMWIATLPPWVQDFIKQIGNRIILFNNRLKPDEEPEAYKKQLITLIKKIDEETKDHPFVHRLNIASKEVLEAQIKQALDESGLTAKEKRFEEMNEEERAELETAKMKVVTLTKMRQVQEAESESGGEATKRVGKQAKASGGCFPGTAITVDKHGRPVNMDSLQFGEEVQVITKEGIRLEPVLTFIHRQPDVIQEYLKIRTKKNKILKITEDHLLFVKTKAHAAAVPARDVKIGDTLYVRVNDVIEEDTVQDISSVFEKGVYAPVTLSGTILVNDVLASCYFDVLSHEWSHMAMGIARTLYHVSPWVVQWISSIGEKDGFPGWCRLVHNMLTLLN